MSSVEIIYSSPTGKFCCVKFAADRQSVGKMYGKHETKLCAEEPGLFLLSSNPGSEVMVKST